MPSLGAGVAIGAFVAIQFVEITLFTVGDFPVTVQKLLAGSLFPLALALMGRVRLSLTLGLLGALLLLAFSLRDVATGGLARSTISAWLVVVFGLLGATVLYTALCQDDRSFPFLARTWVALACISSAVAVLQSLSLLPLFTVGDEVLRSRETLSGFYRGVAFKFDPNFLALVLVIGLAFARVYVRRLQLLILLLLLVGILATFSRMGIFVAGLVLLITAFQREREGSGSSRRVVRGVASVTVAAAVVLFLYASVPDTVRSYVGTRTADVAVLVGVLTGQGGAALGDHVTSAQARLLLIMGALVVLRQHWLWGIGAFRTQDVLEDLFGIHNVVHNTYLEFLLIGGVGGLAFLLGAAWLLWSRTRRALRNGAADPEVRLLSLLIWIFAIGGFFLSIVYNSILWLPFVMAAALARRRHAGGTTVPPVPVQTAAPETGSAR